MAADNLKFLVRAHWRSQQVSCLTAGGVDVRVTDDQVVRADGVAIWVDDLPKFDALRFPLPPTHWSEHVLTLPPTLIIDAVS